jgi:hypothetical protein
MSRTARLTLSLVVALLAPLASARAQNSFSVAAGASFPTSTFGDLHDIGYHVGVGIGIQPPTSPLGFRFEGMFNEFDRSGIGSVKTRVLGATANASANLSGKFGPYLIGGLGLYNTKNTNGGGDSSDIGFNLGGGFRFELTGFSAYAEARYHRVGDGVATFIPVTFGLTF